MLDNFIINFNRFDVICEKVFQNTCTKLNLPTSYCYVPSESEGGATFKCWTNMNRIEGMVTEFDTLFDIRDVTTVQNRELLVLRTGFTLCFNNKKDIDLTWTHVKGNEAILPPHTMAFVINGNVNFVDKGIPRKAPPLHVIDRRPYEMNLSGQLNIILIPTRYEAK